MTVLPSPDRTAPTLAVRAALLAERAPEPAPDRSAPRDAGDARVGLHLLRAAAARTLSERGTPAAHARLDGLDTPDLIAGTIQDGAARGLAVAYEEAISLCAPAATLEDDGNDPLDPSTQVVDGRDLRRKRDLLVASGDGGARIRFSRKGGILVVDRARELHEEHAVWFEDRTDRGDLDAFVPAPDERPRLFSPGFLQPVRFEQGAVVDRLELEGRLGRRARGFPTRLVLSARKKDDRVRLEVAIRNDHEDHRLRIRFLGALGDHVRHDGTPGWEHVVRDSRRFVAATLVRAIGTLRVGPDVVAVPDAQCLGWTTHGFWLGGG